MTASAVLYVKDLQSMTDFYKRCFAMSAEHADKRFCVLASPDWELSLVRVADRVAAAVVIADPPLRREDSPIKLVFDVSDLDHAVSLLLPPEVRSTRPIRCGGFAIACTATVSIPRATSCSCGSLSEPSARKRPPRVAARFTQSMS
jgi:hypothetical protein